MLQQLLLRAEGDCSQQDKPQMQVVVLWTCKSIEMGRHISKTETKAVYFILVK